MGQCSGPTVVFPSFDNTTHKAPEPFTWMGKDDRRVSGHKLMNALSPDKFDLNAMWEVMSNDGKTTVGPEHWAIYNPATIHTETIIPGTGEYHSYEGHQIIGNVSGIGYEGHLAANKVYV